MKKNDRKALLSIPFPLTLRNFVMTGLAAQIEQEFNTTVHLISPYDDTTFSDGAGNSFTNCSVAAMEGTGGLPNLAIVSMLDSFLKSTHLTGFAIEYPDGSLQNITLSGRRNAQWLVAKVLTSLGSRNSSVRKALRSVYALYKPKKREIVVAFDCIKPDFVLVASPGHYWLDHFVLDEAKRRGVPSYCIVLSWDNLYSRGPLCRRPDYMMVWSEEMKRQAVEVHGYPEDRLAVVGALQFLFYDAPATQDEITGMRRRIGLAIDEPYIAYVCGARTGEYDVEDVLAMRQALLGSPYKDFTLVVRPHPQGSKEAYVKLLQYGILLDDKLDLTTGESSAGSFNRSAIRHMAALLTDAEFVISSWGTTVLLEACIFDVPSIQLRWMDAIPHAKPAEVQMVRDFQRYIHMRAFDAEGGRRYCDRPEDLVSIMLEMKEQNARYEIKRKNTVQRIVATPLEGVIPRICQTIKDRSQGTKAI